MTLSIPDFINLDDPIFIVSLISSFMILVAISFLVWEVYWNWQEKKDEQSKQDSYNADNDLP